MCPIKDRYKCATGLSFYIPHLLSIAQEKSLKEYGMQVTGKQEV